LSRPSRYGVPTNTRERLKLEFTRAAPLRDLYPQLAEVRVEFEFKDAVARAPSGQSFSYFPAARGFFRFACPCHSCSGEFDISAQVAELAKKPGASQRSRKLSLNCTGERAFDLSARVPCAISASVHVSATPRTPE
jgi:hypothetical protein